ncbi:hypothetical protein QTP86_014466 [Hemibagrus guttatus]|nr:hypothetical protein QTP86_014466 [Hemibagrus guttatus]
MDELTLQMNKNRDFPTSCVLCFTEPWLCDAIPDSALQLDGFNLYRADRHTELSGKTKGGGICFYINYSWCNDVKVLSQLCSPDLEAFIINCKPFYSPHEFSSFILLGVYIPPQRALADGIHSVERTNCCVVYLSGDGAIVHMLLPIKGVESTTNSLDEYTDTVTSYTYFCEDSIIPTCTRVSYNNDKPWFTAKLRRLRSEKEAAFRSGDRGKYKEAKYKFSEELLISSSSSSYTFIPVSPTQLHTLAMPHPPPLTPLTIKEEEENRLFKRLNTRKATGPDSVSPSLLKHCANQLSPVFTDIFNTSLETCHVPACFKTSAIDPVPKKTKITGLNDYRPVALTSVVMKSFEHLVLSYLKDIIDPLLDPLQFAYRANRSVDDAVNMALHFILQHLDSPGSYARTL